MTWLAPVHLKHFDLQKAAGGAFYGMVLIVITFRVKCCSRDSNPHKLKS